MEILDGQDQGLFLALPDEEVPEGLKDPFPLLAWVELEIGLILHLEGEEILEGEMIP